MNKAKFIYSLQLKISIIVTTILTISVVLAVHFALKREEAEHLHAKEKASKMMAHPILHTIYSDMMDERAEMVYYLLAGLKNMAGVERAQIIRWDGSEPAFTDDKTLREVKMEHEKLRPEWLTPRIRPGKSEAAGIENQSFKAALQQMKSDPKTVKAVYYTEEFEGKRLFTYLVPIEGRKKCNGCHKDGGSRGVLMITTSLEDTYDALRARRNFWIVMGFLTICLVGIAIITALNRTVIRQIKALSQAAMRISDGDLSQRSDIVSGDEVGILASTMNDMAARLQITHSSLESAVETRTEELKEANQELTALTEELTATNEELQASYSQLEATTVELEEANDGLSMANDELKGLDKLKTEFLQTISHELRSPLTPILGYLEMMRDGDMGELSEKHREVIDEMHLCGRNMQLLVDELLEAASVQAGNIHMDFDEVDICHIIRDSVNGVKNYADTNKTELEVKIPHSPAYVEGDRRKLSEIFTHILRNAVKFNHEGGKVLVEASTKEGGVEVSISDTGVGIPKERLENIFEAFYQTESSPTRRYDGVGLGLFLVKRLVDAHGGRVEVKSEVGAGAAFNIFIPRKRSRGQSVIV